MWIFVFFVSIPPLEKKHPTQQSWRSEEMPDWPTNEGEQPMIATLTFVKPKRWTRCRLLKVHKTVHLRRFPTPLTQFSLFSFFLYSCWVLFFLLCLFVSKRLSLPISIFIFSCCSLLSVSILWCILARHVSIWSAELRCNATPENRWIKCVHCRNNLN